MIAIAPSDAAAIDGPDGREGVRGVSQDRRALNFLWRRGQHGSQDGGYGSRDAGLRGELGRGLRRARPARARAKAARAPTTAAACGLECQPVKGHGDNCCPTPLSPGRRLVRQRRSRTASRPTESRRSLKRRCSPAARASTATRSGGSSAKGAWARCGSPSTPCSACPSSSRPCASRWPRRSATAGGRRMFDEARLMARVDEPAGRAGDGRRDARGHTVPGAGVRRRRGPGGARSRAARVARGGTAAVDRLPRDGGDLPCAACGAPGGRHPPRHQAVEPVRGARDGRAPRRLRNCRGAGRGTAGGSQRDAASSWRPSSCAASRRTARPTRRGRARRRATCATATPPFRRVDEVLDEEAGAAASRAAQDRPRRTSSRCCGACWPSQGASGRQDLLEPAAHFATLYRAAAAHGRRRDLRGARQEPLRACTAARSPSRRGHRRGDHGRDRGERPLRHDDALGGGRRAAAARRRFDRAGGDEGRRARRSASAVATRAGTLEAEWVLHAVSAWDETSCVGRATLRALAMADRLGLRIARLAGARDGRGAREHGDVRQRDGERAAVAAVARGLAADARELRARRRGEAGRVPRRGGRGAPRRRGP